MNKFETLIADAGDILGTGLYAERGSICKIFVNQSFHVNIEYKENKDLILIASMIAELPAGRFRELVLKEALRLNDSFPNPGVFSYCQRNNHLAFFKHISITQLSAEKFADQIEQFVDFCEKWKDALSSGNLSSVALPPPRTASIPLGVKR